MLRSTLLPPALLAIASVAYAAPPTVLTSAAENIRVDRWSASGLARGGGRWSIVKTVLHGGRQEGVDVITVDNGRLSFTVVPTRGMSLHRAQMGDERLGWDSPVKEIVNPVCIDLEANGGLGWLEGFNEWLPRGGIEWSGHPGMNWELSFTAHAELRVEQRGVTEVAVRAMLERATGYEPSVVEGRFMIHVVHRERPWIVIVEPDVDAKLLVVVTPYEVSQ